MKQSIHPDYGPVVFRDASAGFSFLTRSTRSSEKTITWEDGRDYPVIDVEVSSASHPFYTGRATVLDTAGRVERFRRRYGQAAGSPATAPAGTAAGTGTEAGTGTGTESTGAERTEARR